MNITIVCNVSAGRNVRSFNLLNLLTKMVISKQCYNQNRNMITYKPISMLLCLHFLHPKSKVYKFFLSQIAQGYYKLIIFSNIFPLVGLHNSLFISVSKERVGDISSKIQIYNIL